MTRHNSKSEMDAMPLSETLSRHVDSYIERNADALKEHSDAIFHFGELGMQEHRTCALLLAALEGAGFEITRELSGFPTGFMASWGSGNPVVALHVEYDGNPGNSQRPGVLRREEIVPGAPGHCEGHNINAAATLAAALATRSAMEAHGLQGTIKLFGAPAEEQLVSRPFYVRDGHFQDVDVALHCHVLDDLRTEHGIAQLGMISADFIFTGVSAHSAMSPWSGRDALDAVVLMDVGMAQFREHMKPGTSAHRVVTQGGSQPNLIPARAAAWWYFRDASAEGARAIFEQAQRIAAGAAMMTGCTVEVAVRAGTWPVRGNVTVAQVIQEQIDRVGMPSWTEAEQKFARDVQRCAGAPETGLKTVPSPLAKLQTPMHASNDSGDISWCIPMGRVWFPSNIAGAPFHHWTAGVALTSTIAQKGAVAAARILACSTLAFLSSPERVEEAKSSHKEEIGDTVYRPLIPDDLVPPVNLNRDEMLKYRAAMEPHYPPEPMQFTS